MLEKYFVKPETVDRIRGSWIAEDIESYLGWLVGHDYSARTVWRRVPVVFAFGEFARALGGEHARGTARPRRCVRGRPSRPSRRTDAVEQADRERGPGACRADALGRVAWFRARWSAVARPALRRR